ncbi:Uncharacterized protein dnm_000250 [Desulfonema magnum]|uniref:Uncharacterized protein n=1 Tax=Desulfonema magnum TaxID=45655 RepID=A0A975BEV7_9BACT|nr:Uncharacterized protein dnm_000250 [Desulfonema magnum]
MLFFIKTVRNNDQIAEDNISGNFYNILFLLSLDILYL